ncbi:CHAT domain-containing protein [Novosphingobium colocasiae]|uniref:CHAT domain-containing tetratricopeptide repeat protein n=1 Tax=Novosphingobium colocasiae TaxID=1256513 RepID=UPI0035B37E79
MRIARLTGGAMAALLALGAGPAFATCSTTPVPQSLPDDASPLDRQFAGLITADRFSDAAGQAERWRAFIRDLKRKGNPDPATLVQAQTWLAWSLDYSDQVDQAQVEGKEALRLIEANGLQESRLATDALSVMTSVLADGGHVAEAADSATRALDLAERLFGAQSAEASFAHNGLGTVAYARGHYADAEREYGISASLAVQCLPPGDAMIVNQLASHAGTLYMIGRVEDALDEGQRAAKWALTNLPESNPTVTLALGNLGALYSATGRYAEAEAALHKVVDLEGMYQTESWFYRAISLSNYAHVLFSLDRVEEAEALWLASLDFHQKATIKRDPISPAFPLRFAADAAEARGDIGLALERRQRAADMIDAAAPADNPERARTRLELAMTMLLANRPAEALAMATPAIAVVRAKYEESDTRRLSAEIAYARLLGRNGRTAEAYDLGSHFAALAETRLLDASTSRGDLVRWGPAFSASFSAMTELALENGRPDEAFRYLQLANLSDVVLVTSEVAARAAASDPRTAENIREFQDRIRQRQTLDRERAFAIGAGDAAEIAQLAARIEENDAAIARAGDELDRLAPQYRQLGRPAPITLADYRASLSPRQALIAPLALDDALITLVVNRDGLTWARVASPRSQVQRQIKALRASVESRNDPTVPKAFDYADARTLYQTLFPASSEAALKGCPELLYYASGALATVPPALLIAADLPTDATGIEPAKVAWLIRSRSVSVLASLRPITGPSRTSANAGRFLGLGGPDLGAVSADPRFAGLPELPAAATELADIGAAVGRKGADILTGAAASEQALRTRDLTRYGVIAFATHGLAGGDRPGLVEPALVLSPTTGAAGPATDSDGLLTASEITQLRLDADWVILSACDTASGTDGQTLGGLAAAFIHAGARSLLVSHWPVRDDAAARLVRDTVRGKAGGLTEAEALRQAQLRLIDGTDIADGADPALWAPFVPVAP